MLGQVPFRILLTLLMTPLSRRSVTLLFISEYVSFYRLLNTPPPCAAMSDRIVPNPGVLNKCPRIFTEGEDFEESLQPPITHVFR